MGEADEALAGVLDLQRGIAKTAPSIGALGCSRATQTKAAPKLQHRKALNGVKFIPLPTIADQARPAAGASPEGTA
jgi:hypothetical protein